MLRIIIVGISFKGRLSSSKIDDSKAFGTYDIDIINGPQSKVCDSFLGVWKHSKARLGTGLEELIERGRGQGNVRIGSDQLRSVNHQRNVEPKTGATRVIVEGALHCFSFIKFGMLTY